MSSVLLLSLLQGMGPWMLLGIAVVIFIESGVLFPFLPGDSLLIAAALLAPQVGVPAWQVGVVAVVAAFCGDQVGYALGARHGRRMFRPDARVLKAEYLERTEAFFGRYGAASLVLGRFVPVVRTYVPLAAGIAAMRYRRFILWNALGGATWVATMVVGGYLLRGIPFVSAHIELIMIGIVALSVVPAAVAVVRRRRAARRQASADDLRSPAGPAPASTDAADRSADRVSV